jgi:hypothetical protein
MRGHIVVAARDHNWQKQQCDPFPKIDCRQQGRLEMETCFCFAILGNGNGNTFLLQAWTWTPRWQVMQDGDGPVMNQPSPLIQRRLSRRPRRFGVTSKQQGRLEMETCFHFAILGNGNGNTFPLQAWTWTPWWQVMQDGDGPVMNQPAPLIQCRLSCRPRLFGIASAALASSGRGGGSPLLGHPYLTYPPCSSAG